MVLNSTPWRFRCVLFLTLLLSTVAVVRIIHLHVFDRSFLKAQGDARTHRAIPIPAYRGTLTDRHGEPLAVSVPVITLWANAKRLSQRPEQWPVIAELLSMDTAKVADLMTANKKKEFIYLRRRLPPEVAEALMAKLAMHDIEDVHTMEESKRFYPSGSLTAHIVGFTDTDEQGREGVELLYNDSLQGLPGEQLVVKDRRGQLVRDLGVLAPAKPGTSLALSIDLRVQHIAKRELQSGMNKFIAKAGSVVVMDIHTGELLAMVNLPSYNPNNRNVVDPQALRNRAMVDVFEPASALKPFSMASALESGRWQKNDTVDVGAGTLKIGRYTIKDVAKHSTPTLSMTDVLIRSSNVGISKIGFDISGQRMHDTLYRLGLGQPTGIGFPGERSGYLPYYKTWREAETATLSYGYGLSLTAVQLAKIYAILANGGNDVSPSILRKERTVAGKQIISQQTAADVRDMLVQVTEAPRGTFRARVAGYHVAGKSGTARQNSTAGPGYAKGAYRAVFAGFAPATEPRFAVVVVVDTPTRGGFYGGLVSAPIFSRIMASTLRLYNVRPDRAAQRTLR